jgi:hypothetical protein
MAVHDPTAANVSLWARFFEEEWAARMQPQPYVVRRRRGVLLAHRRRRAAI